MPHKKSKLFLIYAKIYLITSNATNRNKIVTGKRNTSTTRYERSTKVDYQDCGHLITLSVLTLQARIDELEVENALINLELAKFRAGQNDEQEENVNSFEHIEQSGNRNNWNQPKFSEQFILHPIQSYLPTHKWMSIQDMRKNTRKFKKFYNHNNGLLASQNFKNPICGVCLDGYQLTIDGKWLSLRESLSVGKLSTSKKCGTNQTLSGKLKFCETVSNNCFGEITNMTRLGFNFSPTVCRLTFKQLGIGIFMEIDD